MTLRDDLDKLDIKTNPNINESNIILFTTRLTPSLTEFLQDDFNFELSLRLVGNLKDQLRIRSIKDGNLRFKQLISSLFTNIVLNYLQGTELFSKVKFTYNEYGKPQLIEQGFQFNSSSSNDIVSIVVEYSHKQSPIGIDLSHSVQPAISSRKCVDQFSKIFDFSEVGYLKAIDDEEKRYFTFNHFWTLKESFAKLLGSGLNVNLADFSFKITKEFKEEEYSFTQVNKSKSIEEYKLTWFNSIDVNPSQLIAKKDKFIESLDNKSDFYCHCSILENRQGGSLPVIVTLINQNPVNTIRHIELNFERILQQYA